MSQSKDRHFFITMPDGSECGERPRAGDLHSMHMAYRAGLAYGKGETDAR
jgi:hypothetical protein